MTDPHHTYTFEDGTRLRVLGDAILVKPDPVQTHSASGLIEFADGAMEHTLLTGTILAFGMHKLKNGTRIPLNKAHPDLAVGRKLVFVRFLKEQHTNKTWAEMFEGAIRLTITDAMLVYDPEEQDRLLR